MGMHSGPDQKASRAWARQEGSCGHWSLAVGAPFGSHFVGRLLGDGRDASRATARVDNVVDANVLAMTAKNVSGRAHNVACGERVTVNDLIGELEDTMGASAENHHGLPGDVFDSLADTPAPYRPRVAMRVGVRRSVDFFTASRGLTRRNRSTV